MGVRIIKLDDANISPKLVITVNSINARFDLDKALYERVEKDSLTGLYNREAFFEQAAVMISKKEPGYYVMACFDIDNFKVINDRYGSEKGDEILKFIANTFRSGFESVGGICGRIMSDNFAVMYPKSFIASSKLTQIRKTAVYPKGLNQPMNFRIGRYIIDDLSLPVSGMYDIASIAQASVKGRYDAYIADYDETMREKLLHEQEIINEMDSALASGQFEVWFQPQYNHSTGALIGAEALVRWRHPQKGLLIPPGDFIPVFERSGFIYEMDKYVWEQSCLLIKKWISEGRKPLPISVNVSRYDILRDDV